MHRRVESVFNLPVTKVLELPMSHPAHYHRKYRYCYGTSVAGGSEASFSDQVIKLDMDHPEIA